MISDIGGRKFVLALFGVISIATLALCKADATAFGAIALIVTTYFGANSYIEGKYAHTAVDADQSKP
jgi:uncharacterized membrane-anchored protein